MLALNTIKKELRGAKFKVVYEALGYSSIAFTIGTYSHYNKQYPRGHYEIAGRILPLVKKITSIL